MSKLSYIDFLRSKIPQAESAGFEPPSAAHPSLYPHQRDLSEWACRGGRRAVFAAFGLGKTRMHLQIAKWVTEATGGKYLIVAPLGVRQEFTRSDGPAMGIEIEYVRTTEEALASKCQVLITNYEPVRDGKLDVSIFAGAGLDESSVLRSYGSKTYQEFLPKFKAVKYRYVFTATPSPNQYKELIHYSAFLGIMDNGEALTRFFQRDSEQANNLTLYPHMEETFWAWMNSWACFISSPADLGYDATGYDLPGLQVHWHKVDVDHTKAWKQEDGWGQRQLFLDQATGLAEGAGIKRDSIMRRLEKSLEIMGTAPDDAHWLLWHDLEAERHAVEKALPTAVTVWGTMDLEEREQRIMDFSEGKYRILSTKPVIAGSGCNFQRHCHRAIFMGVGYKFNDFIQAIHRIHRFQQKGQVEIHIVYLESESSIVEQLKAKWRRHDELVERMSAILKENKLQPLTDMRLMKAMGVDRREACGDTFRMVNNDCTLELAGWEENSVDEIVTSIPFGTQYEYCPSYNDFGYNRDNEAFFEQMSYLVPELLRVLKPGRIAAIHVKDRLRFGNVTGNGFPTVDPFSDHTVKAFTDGGFKFMARITIDTDVVRENNQTYRLSMKEQKKDGTKMGAGMPEYVLIFRKLPTDTSNGYADTPVPKDGTKYTVADWQVDAAGLWRSSGNTLPPPEVMQNMPHTAIIAAWRRYSGAAVYDHREHKRLAQVMAEKGVLPGSLMLFPVISKHPDVWDDITRMRTLNMEQQRRQQEMHVCPLQLDIIERLIERYSLPGEVVYDPFAGIGSVPYQAIMMGRKGWGTELNTEYWKNACGYCERAENTAGAPTLFDYLEATAEVAEAA